MAMRSDYSLRTTYYSLSYSKPGRDLGERRTRPVFGRMHRRADMNEAGDLLVLLEAKRVEHAAVVGVPLGDPVGAVAERVRGEHQAHGGGAGREHLLPFRDFHMRAGPAHHCDHHRRTRQPLMLLLDLLGLGVRVLD